METKKCTACGVEQPAENFGRYWHKGVGKRLLASKCRPCLAAYSRKYTADHRDHLRKVSAGYAAKKRRARLGEDAYKCQDCGAPIYDARVGRCEICLATRDLEAQQKYHCRSCNVRMPDSKFRRCPPCREEWKQARIARKARKHGLRRLGITPEQYDAACAFQNGRCSICGTKPDLLCVDHDHATGEVRGLLCGTCNSGLGFFKDKVTTLLAAVEYLKSHPSGSVRTR